MHKCSDVMAQDLLFGLPNDPVEKLAQLMGRRDIGPVLIVENEQTMKLAGIVTDRDLALKIVAQGRDPKSTKAEDVMTRKVMKVYADDDVQKALDMMTELQLRRIPVVDDSDRIVGILTQAAAAARVNQPQKTAAVVMGTSKARGAS